MLAWLKTHSFVNAFAFPGTRKARGVSSYDVHGVPFAGTRKSATQNDVAQNMQLVWIASDGAPSVMSDMDALPAVLVERKEAGKSRARCAVCIAHGNACDAGEMAAEAALWSDALDAHVLVAEYPGYGVATGQPSEASVDAAVNAVYAFLKTHLQVPPQRIVVFGRSIGTGPATALAAAMSQAGTPPAALLLHAPYLSIRQLAVDLFGAIANVLLQRWDTLRNARQVRAPVLLMHAEADQIIPYSHAKRLCDDVASRHAEAFAAKTNPAGSPGGISNVTCTRSRSSRGSSSSCTSPVSDEGGDGMMIMPPVCELHTQGEECIHNEYDIVRDVLIPSVSFLKKHSGNSIGRGAKHIALNAAAVAAASGRSTTAGGNNALPWAKQ